MLHEDRRCVEEEYTVAGNASNLRVEADRRGDGDVIIAAGWTNSRVGMALLRLHSEWDKAAKPRKPTPEAIRALACTLPAAMKLESGAVVRLSKTRRHEMARSQAQSWYIGEMSVLVARLASLSGVRQQLLAYVPRWGIEEAAEKVPAIIAYWLDQTCHHCHGLKFRQTDGAPALSGKACSACNGTGVAPIPHGQDGRRVANYMDDCVSRARSALRERLHSLIVRT